MNSMLIGAIAMTSLVISLFFLRFWKLTTDRFFLFFSMAFFLEAINRILIGVIMLTNEDNPIFYCLRLIAYGLIIFAIIDKNKKKNTSKT